MKVLTLAFLFQFVLSCWPKVDILINMLISFVIKQNILLFKNVNRISRRAIDRMVEFNDIAEIQLYFA